MKIENIYSTLAHGKIGEVRHWDSILVHIYLDISFWNECDRLGRKGMQFLGEFHNFNNFKNSGSFDELTLVDTAVDEYSYLDAMWGVYP